MYEYENRLLFQYYTSHLLLYLPYYRNTRSHNALYVVVKIIKKYTVLYGVYPVSFFLL